jgi:hypothetical protein
MEKLKFFHAFDISRYRCKCGATAVHWWRDGSKIFQKGSEIIKVDIKGNTINDKK